MINEEDIQAVRDRTDIVGLISERVQLKRSGSSWLGCCPFHNDRSPSFSVTPAKDGGLWYCHSCGFGGDTIAYLERIQHLDFNEAVEQLAGRAGVTLRFTDPADNEHRARRKHLLGMVDYAAGQYHRLLLEDPSAGPAREYLRGRGLDGDLVRRFRVGWAPGGGWLAGQFTGVPDQDWRDSGLGVADERGRRDFFYGRVVFPVTDRQGRPVGFSARQIPAFPQNGGKYVNSPSGPVFDKGRVLYGIEHAAAPAVVANRIVLCEGQLDVVACHAAGVPYAVATCGTAATDDHAKIIRGYVPVVIVLFDGDPAGAAATEKLARWDRLGLEVRVGVLPPGMDACDLVLRDRQPDELRRIIDDAVPVTGWRLQRLWAAADLSTPEAVARTVDAGLGMIAELVDPIVRTGYLPQLSILSGVPYGDLAGRLVTMAPPPAPAPQVSGAGAEFEALAATVLDPAAGLSWLDLVLFTDGPGRRAWEAVVDAGGPAGAVAALVDDHEATRLVVQAAASPPADPDWAELFFVLAARAAGRAADVVTAAARVGDPAVAAEDAARLAGWRSLIEDRTAEFAGRYAAGVDLMEWLIGRVPLPV